MFETEQTKSTLKERFLYWLDHSKEIKYTTIRGARLAVLDVIIYVIFLTLASIVSEIGTTYYMYSYSDALQRLLIKPQITMDDHSKIRFEDIRNIERFWAFTTDIFLKFLEKGDFRPNDPKAIYKFPNETTLYDDIYGNKVERIITHGNVLLGPPRLRQIRVNSGQCISNKIFANLTPTCYGAYDWRDESRESFQGYKWVSIKEAHVTPINGEFEWYLGAGFIQSLTYNATKNVEIIERLRDTGWISRNTRIVLIEFNLYHQLTDLLVSVKLKFEQPLFGGLVPSASYIVLRQHSLFCTPDLALRIVTILYHIMLSLFTIRDLAYIRRNGFRTYIGKFFNALDFTGYMLSYVKLILYEFQNVYIASLMKLNKTSDQFISLDWPCVLEFALTNISGIVIFICWIHFLTFLIINRTMTILLKVLIRSINEFIGFAFMLITFLMSYAVSGMVLFGHSNSKFSSLSNALISIISLAACISNYEEFSSNSFLLTRLYYITFVIFIYVVLVLHAFLNILFTAYDEIKGTARIKKSKLLIVIRMFFISIYDLIYLCIYRKRKYRERVDKDAEEELEQDPQMFAGLTIKRKRSIHKPNLIPQDVFLHSRMRRAYKRINVMEEVIVPVLKNILEYYNRLRREQGMREVIFEQLDLDA